MRKKEQYHPILKKEFKRTFPSYLLGMLVNGIQATIHFSVPAVIGMILDLLLQENVEKEMVMQKVYVLILLSFFSIIPRAIYRFLAIRRARISDTDLRKETIKQLQEVKPEYYEREDKGKFLAYLARELLVIRKFLGTFFIQLGRLVLNPIVVLTIIGIQYHWAIPLTVAPILIGITIYIFHLYDGLNQKIEEARKADIKFSQTIEQNSSGFLLIKLYNEQQNQINKFKQINEEKYQADYEIGVEKNKISNAINILYAVCYSATFAVSLLLVQKGILTIGGLTTMVTSMTFVIAEVTQSIPKIVEALGYFELSTHRYNYFFSLEKCKKEGKKLDRINNIELKNIYYQYDGKHEVLKDISMRIEAGEKIGIMGQVGSGKTTLMDLIAGFLEIQQGSIKINNCERDEYAKKEIFKKIQYATQNNIILDDSIENNIKINQEKEIDIEQVSKWSQLYSDVMQMEEGFKTKIGERGNRLSGGQKQRVQIARNLSQIGELNIYDDTLSALDQETEKKVIENMIQQTEGKILIVISNRVSTMQELDRIYVLEEGVITGVGTHKELLKNSKLYREIAQYESAGELQ